MTSPNPLTGDSAESNATAASGSAASQANSAGMDLQQQVQTLEKLLAHMWMVRAFLKHCDEAEDDEDLCEVQRELYDYIHAVGIHVENGNPTEALRFARKKLRRLRDATRLFDEIQEEISTHTNFRMARRSLLAVLESVETLLQKK